MEGSNPYTQKYILEFLQKKNDSRHQSELERINAQYIDLVVVNLYPFEKFLRKEILQRMNVSKI